MKRLLGLLLLGTALICLSSGCSSSGLATVECKVTLDGQPVEGATVTLVPDAASGNTDSATGITGADGTCKLRTGDKDGVKKGKYRIAVVKTPQMAGGDPNPTQENMTDMYRKMAESNKDRRGGPGGPGGMGGATGFAQKNELPSRYGNSDNSGLSTEVPPKDGVVKIELTK